MTSHADELRRFLEQYRQQQLGPVLPASPPQWEPDTPQEPQAPESGPSTSSDA